MAPRPKPWLRLYAETPQDMKIRRLAVDRRWLFIACLCAARQSPEPGRLLVGDQAMTDVELADFASMPPRAVTAALADLEAAGLIERDETDAWRIVAWRARQFESDVSSGRVTALRKRRSNGNVTVDETVSLCTESESETEENSSLNSHTRGHPQPVDDERIAAILERVIDARMRNRPTVKNRSRYRATALATLRAERGADLAAVIASHPTAPDDVLAAWLAGEPHHLANYRQPGEPA